MPDNISQANLNLLIDLQKHLASAERLRGAYEQLLALATRDTKTQAVQSKEVRHVER